MIHVDGKRIEALGFVIVYVGIVFALVMSISHLIWGTSDAASCWMLLAIFCRVQVHHMDVMWELEGIKEK